MSDSPMTSEPAAPSTPGADALSRVEEIDSVVCALMDRVSAIEARVRDLEAGIV